MVQLCRTCGRRTRFRSNADHRVHVDGIDTMARSPCCEDVSCCGHAASKHDAEGCHGIAYIHPVLGLRVRCVCRQKNPAMETQLANRERLREILAGRF